MGTDVSLAQLAGFIGKSKLGESGYLLLIEDTGAAFANLIVNPIKGVAGSLEDIAQGEGDLTRSLQVKGNDETAALAGWFNQFVERIRALVQRIGNASADLQSASETNSRVASNMGDATGRQRQAVELVSTAFNEMVATANEVARSCSNAESSADAGQRQVNAGQQQIEQATSSVARLSENLQQSTEAMQELERESQDINTILGTIRSIAEQTNLLALNAAIEAARAGVWYRGSGPETSSLASRVSPLASDERVQICIAMPSTFIAAWRRASERVGCG